jgi:outer membrane protein OmpA-like peptidoglycan-associated protein
VAVLDPADGSERGTLNAANERAALTTGGGHVRGRIVPEAEVQQKYGELIKYLPPQLRPFDIKYINNGATIAPNQDQVVRDLSQEVVSRSGAEVQVIGYTDTTGTDEYDDDLSRQRAEAMRDFLVQHGVPSGQIRVSWRGKRELLVPTPDNTPNEKNRRVVVIVR